MRTVQQIPLAALCARHSTVQRQRCLHRRGQSCLLNGSHRLSRGARRHMMMLTHSRACTCSYKRIVGSKTRALLRDRALPSWVQPAVSSADTDCLDSLAVHGSAVRGSAVRGSACANQWPRPQHSMPWAVDEGAWIGVHACAPPAAWADDVPQGASVPLSVDPPGCASLRMGYRQVGDGVSSRGSGCLLVQAVQTVHRKRCIGAIHAWAVHAFGNI
jgi:hypothetical protein